MPKTSWQSPSSKRRGADLAASSSSKDAKYFADPDDDSVLEDFVSDSEGRYLDNGGSLLDSCAMVFLIEGGFRSGTGSVPGGQSHTTENMACLVAGGAGGLRQGEHVVAPDGSHPANVLVTLMNAVGVSTSALGDVQGTIPGLLG